jgi:D-3-phosphoglycerate dehydrogenase / 2-oxoglutarate reductase
MQPYLIIDFDSTFVALESLDELANIALADSPDRESVMADLKKLTDLGMEGKIGFGESLERRVAMFKASRAHIDQLIMLLHEHVTPSIVRNRAFFKANAERIYIMSGGFADYILPVAADFGLDRHHVLANRFDFDDDGIITGYDKSCPLAHDNGKVEQVGAMRLDAPVYIIGDGYTDYAVRAAGRAEKFFAFTENVRREAVAAKADRELADFDELLNELSASSAGRG